MMAADPVCWLFGALARRLPQVHCQKQYCGKLRPATMMEGNDGGPPSARSSVYCYRQVVQRSTCNFYYF